MIGDATVNILGITSRHHRFAGPVLAGHKLGTNFGLSFLGPLRQTIERAGHSDVLPVDDMRVNHRRLDVLMPQQLLDGADVRALM